MSVCAWHEIRSDNGKLCICESSGGQGEEDGSFRYVTCIYCTILPIETGQYVNL